MPRAGNRYTVELLEAHLGWGDYRHTNTREHVEGEGYIPIPRKYAEEYQIFNSNAEGAETHYQCTSDDGTFQCVLLAQGCSQAGDIYAKQFAGHGNLKALGQWFESVGAKVGDSIEVMWTSPVDIVIKHIRI